MKDLTAIIWGLILVLVGMIMIINQVFGYDINIFFSGWWTIFIIIPCLIDLINPKESDKMAPLIGLIIGVCLLLVCQDIISFEIIWKLFIPVVLVIIGLSLIFKNIKVNKIKKKVEETKDKKEYIATFSSQDLKFENEEFSGCDLNAVFGGIKCNIAKSSIKKDVIINASSIFGGIDLIVPKGVNVKVNSTSIFGGVSNKIVNDKDNKVTVYVNANCLFGGVDIK